MGSTNLTSEKKSDILKMRAQGHSFRKIAEALNVGKQTAVDVCKECEEELSALRALEWEELYEKERITKEERIKAHSELLSKIRREISDRTLADVPTEKLIELVLKVNTSLSEEMVEPRFLSTEEQEQEQDERELLNSLTQL